MNTNIEELESIIEYSFNNKELLVNALTHTSYVNENPSKDVFDNERLEYLGDAVLEVVSSKFIYQSYPDMNEGEMTKFRASLVCEPTLANDARDVKLPNFLYLGKGEESSGGRNRDSIISDAFEALIAAIFLDGGYEKAEEFIMKFAMNDIEHKRLFNDSKSILQERVEKTKRGELEYKIIDEQGPDHDKTFTVAAIIDGKTVGTGVGPNKKAAEQKAAFNALKDIEG